MLKHSCQSRSKTEVVLQRDILESSLVHQPKVRTVNKTTLKKGMPFNFQLLVTRASLIVTMALLVARRYQ